MFNSSIILSLSKAEVPALPKSQYESILDSYNIKYDKVDPYLMAGTPKQEQGWILHISVITSQMFDLLHAVLPILAAFRYPFKVIKDTYLHKKLNSGMLGHFKIGKVITIYLDEDANIAKFTKQLINATKPFIGPQIMTDFFISSNLFTRYGSFIPLTEYDSYENKICIIKDNDGNKYLDKYYNPPIVPIAVPNPFIAIIENESKQQKSIILNKKYLSLKMLKADPKGDVWKGLYIKNLIPKWCIIKQGRIGMHPDEIGRDCRDRLAWQYEVNRCIRGELCTPNIFDSFELEGNSFIVMEYLKNGCELDLHITKTLNRNAWFDQTIITKKNSITLLINTIKELETIHDHGFVHRDLTGRNIIVTKGDKINFLDLELLYSIRNNIPTPPFERGTPGYMSPSQTQGGITPCIEDDIYSVGALMILIFTAGISPIYIIDRDKIILKNRLLLFTRNLQVTELIVECLANGPENRPSLKAITANLISLTNKLDLHYESKNTSTQIDRRKEAKLLIEGYVKALSSSSMAHEGLWFSKIENEYGTEVYPLVNKHNFSGVYRGIGGVIWSLLQIKKMGIDISPLETNIKNGVDFLHNNLAQNINNLNPTLFYGKAGIALVLTECIKESLLKDTISLRQLISESFTSKCQSYDIINGTAGQGIGAMHCCEVLKDNNIKQSLHSFVAEIISCQQKDGSWSYPTGQELKQKAPLKINGFGYGVAGISYFLLDYATKYNDTQSLNSANKAIKYLVKNMRIKNNHIEWSDSNKNKHASRWWCQGAPGIALTFLKSYSITKDKLHLQLAEKSLKINPPFLTSNDLNLCHGLCGLGEIYLEMFIITKNEEWMARATWILDIVLSLKKSITEERGNYLQAEYMDLQTADLMIGNSGVAHFLLRYTYPDKTNFPFLNI